MINKLLYLLGLILAVLGLLFVSTPSASAAQGRAGIVQTSSNSAVYCTDGLIYMILIPDDVEGIKPISIPVGTPCSPEKLAQVPGGEPGIFTDPSQGFVVTFTDDPAWTGHIVERCHGSTLYTATVFEDVKPSVQAMPNSQECRDAFAA